MKDNIYNRKKDCTNCLYWGYCKNRYEAIDVCKSYKSEAIYKYEVITNFINKLKKKIEKKPTSQTYIGAFDLSLPEKPQLQMQDIDGLVEEYFKGKYD